MTKFFKVNDGKLETLRAWCSLLMSTLKEEAEASLREENVFAERLLLFRDGDTYYARGEMETTDPKPANMNRPTNRIHKYVMHGCLTPSEEPLNLTLVETLYEITNT